MYHLIDGHNGNTISKYRVKARANSKKEKLDLIYGAYRYHVIYIPIQ